MAASLAAAALPSSMVLAISTSSSALSSGTRPISLRYVWTGSSELPPESLLEAVPLPVRPCRWRSSSRRRGRRRWTSGRPASPSVAPPRRRGLLLRRHEGDAFGRDAIDEGRQHFWRELDRVQRFDQFGLRELSLATTGRERRFEVDLRHAGREARHARWTPATSEAASGRSTSPSSIATAESSLTLALPTVVTPRVASESTTLPIGRPRRDQSPDSSSSSSQSRTWAVSAARACQESSVTRDSISTSASARLAASRRSTTTTESTGSPSSGSPDIGSSTMTRRNRLATSGDAVSTAS